MNPCTAGHSWTGLKRLRGQVSASWSPFVTWRRSPCSDHHASEVPHCWGICFILSEKGHKRQHGTEEQVTVVSCHPHILLCWRVGCERPPLRPRVHVHALWWVGRHVLAFEGHPRPTLPGLRVPCRGKPLCRPGWSATLPMKAASVLGPHTKCPLSEAGRPTGHGIPPSAEAGSPTLEESCCIVSSGGISPGTEV